MPFCFLILFFFLFTNFHLFFFFSSGSLGENDFFCCLSQKFKEDKRLFFSNDVRLFCSKDFRSICSNNICLICPNDFSFFCPKYFRPFCLKDFRHFLQRNLVFEFERFHLFCWYVIYSNEILFICSSKNIRPTVNSPSRVGNSELFQVNLAFPWWLPYLSSHGNQFTVLKWKIFHLFWNLVFLKFQH
jgi:hypothetical protein